jgi:hypothetical protein
MRVKTQGRRGDHEKERNSRRTERVESCEYLISISFSERSLYTGRCMKIHSRRRGGVERAYGLSDEDRHINM